MTKREREYHGHRTFWKSLMYKMGKPVTNIDLRQFYWYDPMTNSIQDGIPKSVTFTILPVDYYQNDAGSDTTGMPKEQKL